MRRTTLVSGLRDAPAASGRPDPCREQLGSGSLKLFFGYAPSSGVTSAMLDEARGLMASGRDVLVAGVDEGGGPKTAAFDLDQALKRSPDLVVLENMSCANPPDHRNRTRYRDIEELLRAGIDVYATLRVSDLLNEQDRVCALGVEGPEDPVPDYLFYGAQQLEFVDIDPAELLGRYRSAGKEGPGASVLRELRVLALRCVAEYTMNSRPSSDMAGVEAMFHERVLAVVEVGEAPRDVLMSAARIAGLVNAPREAVCVLRPSLRDAAGDSTDPAYSLLADQVAAIGFSLETLYGDDPAEVVRDYIRAQGVSDVVLARHKGSAALRFLLPFQPPFSDRIVDDVEGVRVHLVGERSADGGRRSFARSLGRLGDVGAKDLLVAILAVVSATVAARTMLAVGFGEGIAYLIWAAAVGAVATFTRSYPPSLFAAAACAVVQDYYFIRPYLSLSIDHRASAATFAAALVMLAAFGAAVCRISRSAERSHRRERHTQALFDLNRSLVYAHNVVEVVDASIDALGRLFGRSVAFYVRDPFARPSRIDRRSLRVRAVDGDLGPEEFEKVTQLAIAHWVFANGEIAGSGMSTSGESDILFLPLSEHDEVVGVIGISALRPLDMGDRSYLELVTNQIVLAFERQTLLVDHLGDVRHSKAAGVRDAFVGMLLDSASVSSGLVHDIVETMSKPSSSGQYRDALARACADETARSHLMIDRVLAVLASEGVEPDCDLRAQVKSAVDDVRSGLAGKIVSLESSTVEPLLLADSALVRLACRLILEAATSYVGKNGSVVVDLRDEGAGVSVVFSDDRPGDLGNIKPAAFEGGSDPARGSRTAYDEHRAKALRDVYRDAGLMCGDAQDLLAALCRASRIPEEVVRDDGDGAPLNRRRLQRYDRIEYGLYMAAIIARAHGGTIRQRYRLGGGAVISFSLPKER